MSFSGRDLIALSEALIRGVHDAPIASKAQETALKAVAKQSQRQREREAIMGARGSYLRLFPLTFHIVAGPQLWFPASCG